MPALRERRRGQLPLLPVVRRAAAQQVRGVLRPASGHAGRRGQGATRLAVLRERRAAPAAPLQHLVGRIGRRSGLALRGGSRTPRPVRRPATRAPAALRSPAGHAPTLAPGRPQVVAARALATIAGCATPWFSSISTAR